VGYFTNASETIDELIGRIGITDDEKGLGFKACETDNPYNPYKKVLTGPISVNSIIFQISSVERIIKEDIPITGDIYYFHQYLNNEEKAWKPCCNFPVILGIEFIKENCENYGNFEQLFETNKPSYLEQKIIKRSLSNPLFA